MVADHLREIADVAGGLRGEGGAEVDRRQRPFDVVAEPFEQAADAFQLGDEMRRGAVVAPFMRQRDAQPAGIALDQRRCRAPAGDQNGMNSPGAPPRQASTNAAVSRTLRADWQPWIETSPLRSDRCGAIENTPRETFRPIVAVDAGRNADRAAAVGGMRDRQHAGRDHRRAARRRAAGGVVGVPRIAGDIDGGFSAELQTPNSGVVLRPMMLSPAWRILRGEEAVRRGRDCRASAASRFPAAAPSASGRGPSSDRARRRTARRGSPAFAPGDSITSSNSSTTAESAGLTLATAAAACAASSVAVSSPVLTRSAKATPSRRDHSSQLKGNVIAVTGSDRLLSLRAN